MPLSIPSPKLKTWDSIWTSLGSSSFIYTQPPNPLPIHLINIWVPTMCQCGASAVAQRRVRDICWGCGETESLVDGNTKRHRKHYGGSSKKKLKIELLYDSETPCLGTHPKELKAGSQRYLYNHIHSNIIGANTENNPSAHQQMSGWARYGYTYNRILLGLKKDGDSDTCYGTDETYGPCAKENKPDTKGKSGGSLYQSLFPREAET